MKNKLLRFLFIPLFLFLSACFIEKKDIPSYLTKALLEKDMDQALYLLSQDPSVTDLTPYKSPNGDTFLHLIAKQNNINAFNQISGYTLPYNTLNQEGLSPLYISIKANYCQLAELLLIKGEDPSIIPNNRSSMLSLSLFNQSYSCMESLLLNKANPNQLGFGGWTTLHYAAYIGDNKALSLLLKYELNPLLVVDLQNGLPFYSPTFFLGISSANPLQIAIVKGHKKFAQTLLSQYKVELTPFITQQKENLQELAKTSKDKGMIEWVDSLFVVPVKKEEKPLKKKMKKEKKGSFF